MKCETCENDLPAKVGRGHKRRFCDSCVKARTYARHLRWRRENPEKYARNMNYWRLKNPAESLYLKAKSRAKRRGIEFNIDKEDVVVPDICPVLGIKIIPGSTAVNRNSPSLDRIDNSKGYVKGNVAVISHRANHLKNSGTIEEHEMIAAWMKRMLT